MEGLPDQRPRPAQDHDARRGRVHPPLSPARAAERLPPHPPLRPVRWRRSRPQHRARPPSARRAEASPKRSRAEADSETETRFASAPMPLLRRPDDHRRDVRRRAPGAPAVADPDQDRHLMTVAALPASQRRFSSRLQPRAGAGTRRPHDLRKPPPSATPAPVTAHPRPRKSPSSSAPADNTGRLGPRRPIGDPSAILKSP